MAETTDREDLIGRKKEKLLPEKEKTGLLTMRILGSGLRPQFLHFKQIL